MPTPATHLALAGDILRRSDLLITARRLLTREPGPFLLGHTAPDVKAVSGQRREECHFYTIPRTSDRPAYEALFDAYPSLAHIEALPLPQVAFVAGYIAHLLLDELWLDEIFQRYFLRDWGPLRERLFLHNVLRTWIDRREQESLDGTVTRTLREAEPDRWLPFVDDEHLHLWRDWLVDQLAPGRNMETAEVLARRMGISAAEVEAAARSGQQMEERIFRHIPRSALQAYRETGYEVSVGVVNSHVSGQMSRPAGTLLVLEEASV